VSGAVEDTFRSLGSALERLREALAQPLANPLAIDGTLQRFEFSIELFWKVLRRLLAQQGVQTATPKEALRKAYSAGWLDDETAWLQMLADRNATSHLYDETAARVVYERIRGHAAAMDSAYRALATRFGLSSHDP